MTDDNLPPLPKGWSPDACRARAARMRHYAEQERAAGRDARRFEETAEQLEAMAKEREAWGRFYKKRT